MQLVSLCRSMHCSPGEVPTSKASQRGWEGGWEGPVCEGKDPLSSACGQRGPPWRGSSDTPPSLLTRRVPSQCFSTGILTSYSQDTAGALFCTGSSWPLCQARPGQRRSCLSELSEYKLGVRQRVPVGGKKDGCV